MNVTEVLHDLVADEPVFVLRPEEVLVAGRRRRRRRTLALSGTAGAAAVVTLGSFALLSSPGSSPTTVRFAGAPTAAANQDTGDLSNEYYRVARASTPDGWTISDAHLEHESGWWADVDDGVHGPGRLGIWRSASSLQQHPCSDSEFVAAAASCTETMLTSTTRLIVRSVSRTNAINDIQVVIVHADGSGVNVSDDNATWPDPRIHAGRYTAEDKMALNRGTIGSPEPLYSTDQLVAMAKALDSAAS